MEQVTKKTIFSPTTIVLMLIVSFVTAYAVYQKRANNKSGKDILLGLGSSVTSPAAIVTILGVFFGLAEFILVDNINKYGLNKESIKHNKLFELPDKQKLKTTLITLAITSLITGLLTDFTIKQINKNKEATI